ncbi:MAG: undecaprenyl-diphosphate phosphatase [Tannerella sp.]|jgi:undecaprenyl-diphosphatase|nr:undecaprenyl-diphosphate phosphatase [Tannerella sp.]
MSIIQTLVIAIVEGLTEFLPISSTGHMIIVQHLLGVESSEFVKTFTVVIQFGAILSVLCLYWRRFLQSWSFYGKLLVAFIPAGVVGFLCNDYIDELLENVWVVAAMLLVGGVFMLFVDRLFNRPEASQEVSTKKAFYIGLFQCIAMIPGVSRSMATIVGGMAQKLNRKTAAEFSFFLAVPTMCAASAWKLLKLFLEPNGASVLGAHIGTLVWANLVAFVVAMAAIRFFIGYITKYGFKAFGYYRIIVGCLILVLLLSGHNLDIA